MNFETARAVANLANSAGCNFTGPNTSQEWEPFVLTGLKMVAKSSNNRPI